MLPGGPNKPLSSQHLSLSGMESTYTEFEKDGENSMLINAKDFLTRLRLATDIPGSTQDKI